MYPEVPLVPAFIVLMVILPLEVGSPKPDEIENKPPVFCASVRPADIVISPPVNVVPVPTLSMMSPPLPLVAWPVESVNEPDVPLLVVPEAKCKYPLVPANDPPPALTDLIFIEPEVVAVDAPDLSDIAPPVALAPTPLVSSV
jgi:hypothetical protein